MGSKLFLARGRNGECEELEVIDRDSTRGRLAITAAVGAGGANRPDDVLTIQQALNAVPPADGGPEPPLATDGKSGPLTRSAIGKFQWKQFGWADSRVDTNNVTIARLRMYNGQAPAPLRAGGPGVRTPALAPKAGGKAKKKVSAEPADTTVTVEIVDPVMERVKSLTGEAMTWAFAAQHHLFLARQFLTGVTGTFRSGAERSFALVNKYFHLDKVKKGQAIDSIDRIHLIYTNIRVALGHVHPTGYMFRDPTTRNRKGGSDSGYTFYGGFTARSSRNPDLPRMSKEDHYQGANLREDSIFICTEVIQHDLDEWVTNLIVHEFAHFVGPGLHSPHRIGDHSYRHRANFFLLSPQLAIRTADCYSQFAGEARFGRELTPQVHVLEIDEVVI